MSNSEILSRFPPEKSNLLLILHELQKAGGKNYVSEDTMRETAEYLNVTYSAVYGVATYYSMFSVEPRGRHVIRVCKSPVCDMVGSTATIRGLETLLGISVGETTADGLFTLEESACLGRCESAPSMMIDDRYYGSLNSEKLSQIIERLRNEGE